MQSCVVSLATGDTREIRGRLSVTRRERNDLLARPQDHTQPQARRRLSPKLPLGIGEQSPCEIVEIVLCRGLHGLLDITGELLQHSARLVPVSLAEQSLGGGVGGECARRVVLEEGEERGVVRSVGVEEE